MKIQASVFILLFSISSQALTICTATINSSDEKEAIVKAFPEAEFIELTELDPHKSNWWTRACQEQINCNVLLISGHFAERFFSDFGDLELPLSLLEQTSCQRQCSGIMNLPAAVFFFGCNTLAGKQPDHRSPQEYLRILIGDGLEADFSARVAAFRYSPLGQETQGRMRKVFSGVPMLFGFTSTSPIGSDAGPAFLQFLNQIKQINPNIFEALRTRPELRARIAQTWNGIFRDTVILEGGTHLTADQCQFLDPKSTRLEKLLAAQRLLQANPLENAISVLEFLSKEKNWNEKEQAVLTRISKNQISRDEVTLALRFMKDSPTLYFSILKLGRAVGWYSDGLFEELSSRTLKTYLMNGVSNYERDFFCDEDLVYNPPPEVYPVNRDSANFIEALVCLSSRNPLTRDFLFSHLKSSRWELRVLALDSLSQLKLFVPSDIPFLLEALKDPKSEIRESAVGGLGTIPDLSEPVQVQIANMLFTEEGSSFTWTVMDAIKKMTSPSKGVFVVLASALGKVQPGTRRWIAISLKGMHPKDPEILSLFEPFRNDSDKDVQDAINSLFKSPI